MAGPPPTAAPPRRAARRQDVRRVPAWSDGAWQEVALRARDELGADECIEGPALLIERGATVWLEPGWSASAAAAGLLRVCRAARSRAALEASATAPDPLRLEIFNGLFMHVAEQMGVVLRQTASSVNIKERLDYSCAVFDGAANLVANAPHMPVHLGSMGASVAAVIEAHGNDLRPGDSGPQVPALRSLLHALGDMADGASAPATPPVEAGTSSTWTWSRPDRISPRTSGPRPCRATVSTTTRTDFPTATTRSASTVEAAATHAHTLQRLAVASST